MTDITFFCSPIGLGHATRDVAIANSLRNSIEFVSGSGAAKLLEQSGFLVKNAYIPPQFDVKNGNLQNSLKWLWEYYKYYKNCKNISKKIIEGDLPKVIVSDEDFASLSVAQNKKIPNVLITDILETNFTTGFGSIIEKKMNKSMSDIINKCDIVIIPEDGPSNEKIKRVGPIIRKTSESRETLREKFGFKKKTILVTIGGTDAGKFLIDKLIDIIPKITDDIEIIFVTGPSLKSEIKGSRNLGFVNNLHEYILAADLVISLAGKSTIDETRAYGTPGIFIPIKGHFEQEDNARTEGYEFDDILRIEELIIKKLNEKRNSVNTEGAKRASELIESLV